MTNLISADTRLTADNAGAIGDVCEKFNIDITDMCNEIESKVSRASLKLGAKWYREANAFAYGLAVKYDIQIATVAAVISALSPRMGWVRNKKIAEHVIAEYDALCAARQDHKDAEWIAGQIKGALSANILMAVRILKGWDIDTVLTGTKRRSFYNNIVSAGTSDDVTIDTWMQRVAMAVSPDQGMDLDDSLRFLNARKGKGYIAIAVAVRAVAKRMNVPPSTVQAAYWIAASGSVHGWHWKGEGKTEANIY